MKSNLPSSRVLNGEMTESQGKEVVRLDMLPIATGQRVRVLFESVTSNWPQGVWLATEGVLRLGDVEASQIIVWQDTAPPVVDLDVLETDGYLRLYNVWDSGRGRGHESNSATSGMLVESVGDIARRYRCNDIGYEPDFDKLVFTLRIA